MPRYRLREIVLLSGVPHTVEQIAEEPKGEPRYWLQQGKDFESRVWKLEHEIGTPADLAQQFQLESGKIHPTLIVGR
jgi:hypothetical protein